MKVTEIIPLSIRKWYHRFHWFVRHFSQIKKNSKLLSGHFHGPIAYDADGMTISQNSDFMHEKRFVRAYEAAASTNPWKGFSSHWRVYIMCKMAERAMMVRGDFVECGVNTGAYAKAIITYMDFNFSEKTFFLFDTFDGLDMNQVSEEELVSGVNRYVDKYKGTLESVKKTFDGDRVCIIPGIVPDTLSQCESPQIAFLSIDMNCVAPEIAALTYFYPKMVKGGIIVLDDYGFPKHIHQKRAFDRFAAEHRISILSLPTGQGIIFV